MTAGLVRTVTIHSLQSLRLQVLSGQSPFTASSPYDCGLVRTVTIHSVQSLWLQVLFGKESPFTVSSAVSDCRSCQNSHHSVLSGPCLWLQVLSGQSHNSQCCPCLYLQVLSGQSHHSHCCPCLYLQVLSGQSHHSHCCPYLCRQVLSRQSHHSHCCPNLCRQVLSRQRHHSHWPVRRWKSSRTEMKQVSGRRQAALCRAPFRCMPATMWDLQQQLRGGSRGNTVSVKLLPNERTPFPLCCTAGLCPSPASPLLLRRERKYLLRLWSQVLFCFCFVCFAFTFDLAFELMLCIILLHLLSHSQSLLPLFTCAGHMNCYFRLASQFRTQDEPAYCGLSTLIMVLNAMEIDPGRVWKGQFSFLHCHS